MPINLIDKKSNALSRLVDLIPKAFLVAAEVQEIVSYITDNGFLTSGASPIADADCIGTNSHLDAALFNAAVGAINTITLSNPNKLILRKATTTPLPF